MKRRPEGKTVINETNVTKDESCKKKQLKGFRRNNKFLE
jgi:hypothetical protein